MLSLSARTRDLIRQGMIAVTTVVVLVLSAIWPKYSYVIWGIFLSGIAVFLYVELRKPVNYDSILISEIAINYSSFGQSRIIPFKDISKVTFVREEALFPDLTGPYIESKWMVVMIDGGCIEIMDEWPHRRLLLLAFEKHLAGFNRSAAKAGIKAFKEGNWECFRSNT